MKLQVVAQEMMQTHVQKLVTVTDGVRTDTITVTVTVTDMAPIIASGQTANLAESAANGDDVMTVSTTGDAATAFVIQTATLMEYSR